MNSPHRRRTTLAERKIQIANQITVVVHLDITTKFALLESIGFCLAGNLERQLLSQLF